MDGLSPHDHWETFTSNSASLSFFSSIGVIGGFESVTTSSAMIESSPTLIKTKRAAGTIWYLHSKGVDVFIQGIRVGVMCSSDDKTS